MKNEFGSWNGEWGKIIFGFRIERLIVKIIVDSLEW
jgi:hypothetical protein